MLLEERLVSDSLKRDSGGQRDASVGFEGIRCSVERRFTENHMASISGGLRRLRGSVWQSCQQPCDLKEEHQMAERNWSD